jgi:hypothetical protein
MQRHAVTADSPTMSNDSSGARCVPASLRVLALPRLGCLRFKPKLARTKRCIAGMRHPGFHGPEAGIAKRREFRTMLRLLRALVDAAA